MRLQQRRRSPVRITWQERLRAAAARRLLSRAVKLHPTQHLAKADSRRRGAATSAARWRQRRGFLNGSNKSRPHGLAGRRRALRVALHQKMMSVWRSGWGSSGAELGGRGALRGIRATAGANEPYRDGGTRRAPCGGCECSRQTWWRSDRAQPRERSGSMEAGKLAGAAGIRLLEQILTHHQSTTVRRRRETMCSSFRGGTVRQPFKRLARALRCP